MKLTNREYKEDNLIMKKFLIIIALIGAVMWAYNFADENAHKDGIMGAVFSIIVIAAFGYGIYRFFDQDGTK